MPTVRVDGAEIRDWDTLHTAFASAFGFPEFYGRNMNAWIDCMTYLDDPAAGMTSIHGSPNDPVVLHLENASQMPQELFDAVVQRAAFVNWRRLEMGESAILMVACDRTG